MSLPPDVAQALHRIEEELADGEITQKGYEKRRTALFEATGLSDYMYAQGQSPVTAMHGAAQALPRSKPHAALPDTHTGSFADESIARDTGASQQISLNPVRDEGLLYSNNSNGSNGYAFLPPATMGASAFTPPRGMAQAHTPYSQSTVLSGTLVDEPGEMMEEDRRRQHQTPHDFYEEPVVADDRHMRRRSTEQSGIPYSAVTSPDWAQSSQRPTSSPAGPQLLPLEPRDIPFAIQDPHNPQIGMSTFDNIAAVLRHRGRSNPKKAAFMVLEAKGKEMATITWDKLASRAEKVAQVIRDKSGLYRGDRVALVYRDCEVIDFAIALFGCFIAGVVAVPINKQEDFQELTTILAATQAHLALTTDTNLKVFHRELSLNKLSWPRGVEWWKTNEFGSFHPKKKEEAPPLQAPDLAYVEYSKSPTGDLRGVVISHRTVMHQMASLSAIITAAPSSMRDKYVPERDRQGKPVMPRSNGEVLVTYLDPRQAIGLILGILLAVYYGNTTVWCPTGAVATPGLLAHIITRYRATLLLADYPGLKTVAYNYQNDPMSTRGKKHHVDFSTIKLCLVDCLTVDSEFHEILADRWLRPLGNKRSQEVLTPMLCLPEHGGMVISMKDWLGGQERISGLGVTVEDAEENDLTEVLLDQEALKSNEIVVVATGADVPKRAADPATVRVGSFFYPLVDATLAVVDPETSRLCSSTTVGEIWIDSPSMSACYWLLPRHTDTIFHARPYFLEPNTGETQVFEQEFLRTGLLGFVIQGRIFVLGLYEDRLRQKVEWVEDAQEITEYRYHYVTHLVNTIMRNVPKIFDCSAFDVYVNKEHLPVVLLESPSASTSPLTPSGPARILDNDLLEALAEKVIEALLENHQVRVYSVLICAPDTLPRVSRNGREEIGNMLCRKVFERGSLPTVMVKFAVERAVLNLPVGADPVGGIWSRLATERRALDLQLESKQYSGVDVRATCLDERTSTNLADFGSIVEIFQWRASRQVEELALLSIDSRGKEGKAISWRKLDLKISATASHLKNKLRLKSGEQVILMYTHSEEFLFVVHACFALGITAIPIAPIDPSRLSEDVPALLSIIADYKVKHILVNNETNTALQSKFVNQHLKQSALALKITLPQICNTAKPTKQTKGCRENGFVMEQSWLRLGYPALVWTYWSPDQRRTCVTLDHAALMGCCKVQKETCQMPASRPMLGCIRSTSGLGFLHSFLMGMFVGCATYLMSPVDFAANPLFLSQVIARYKMKDCYVTPQSMEHLMQAMQGKGPSLHELKNLMIAFDGRVAPHAFPRMRQQLGPSGLDASALNATYGHVVNPMLATRSYMCVEPIEVCLDTRALRAGYIRFTKPSEDPSGLVLHDSGMVPVSTQIAIVNPETCTLCRNGEFGEIWVASEASAIGFHESADPFDIERFNGQIADVETRNTYIRTGDLGFLHTVARPVSRGQGLAELQTLFVLGCIGETFEVNGLNHFPMDIESTVERCHRAIARGGSAVFQAGDQVVLLVEVLRTTHLSGVVPVIVNAVLDEHQIIVDKVAFCARGDFPRSRLREKQRGRILASWIKKQLKTCIVYNVRNGERHLDSADTMNMAQEPLGAIGEIMDGLEDDDQEGPPQGAAAMYGKSIPGSGHSRPERGTARLSMSSSVQGLPTDATQAELEAARALRTGTSSLAGDAETSARPSHDQSSFDDFGRPTEEHQSAVHQGFLKLKPIRSANPEARGNGEPRLSYEADDRDLSWLHSPQSDAGLQAYLEGSGGISSDLATPDSRTEYGIGR